MAPGAAAKGKIHVTIKWDTTDFPAAMKVYELKAGSTLPLWTTGSVTKDKDLPVGKEIATAQGVDIDSGTNHRMVLVMKNPAKKDLYFFATPHTVDPAKHSLGFDFRCLCLNHAYKVPAGATWYRVVELRLDPDYTGKSVEVQHGLVAVTEKRAKQIQTKGAEVPPPKA